MLAKLDIQVKLIVKTDSAAAKQSVEKVALLHVKHMSMWMLFLKDLQKTSCIEVEKNLGTDSPADMHTKPLTTEKFQQCRQRLPGLRWSNGEEDPEIQLLEAGNNFGIANQNFFTWLVEQLISFCAP